MQAANDLLNNTSQTPGVKSYGPSNFSVAAYAGPTATVALLHSWGDPEFEAAVASIPNVTITQGTDPVAMTTDAAEAAGATWGTDAAPLTGNVSIGLYQDDEGTLWWVKQPYNTAIYQNPSELPAQIEPARVPGVAVTWYQPSAEYPFKLVNSFTGQPDTCTHNGFTWKVTQADGAGNNVWEPGVFGWTKV